MEALRTRKNGLAATTLAAGVAVVLLASTASASVVRPRFRPPKLFDGIAKSTLTKVADLNGDGRPDLLSGGTDLIDSTIVSVIVVQLNTGNGFGPLHEIVVRDEHAANGLDAVKLSDVNGDGISDVVGGFKNVFPAASNLFVMLGEGNGGFRPASLLSNGDPLARTVLSVDVADVNGDSNPDIVSSYGDSSPNQLSVLPGNGNGTFGSPILSGDTDIHFKPSIVVADFTGDGIPDVMAADSPLNPDFGATDLLIEKGEGDGTFTLEQSVFVDANVIDSSAAADLDGNGRTDLAVEGSAGTNGGRGGLFVSLASGQGLGAAKHYAAPGAGLQVADLNLDGSPDIATAGAVAPYVWLRLNAGNGTFPMVARYTGTGPQIAAAADFTGDGKPDIVSENFSDTVPASLMVNRT